MDGMNGSEETLRQCFINISMDVPTYLINESMQHQHMAEEFVAPLVLGHS